MENSYSSSSRFLEKSSSDSFSMAYSPCGVRSVDPMLNFPPDNKNFRGSVSLGHDHHGTLNNYGLFHVDSNYIGTHHSTGCSRELRPVKEDHKKISQSNLMRTAENFSRQVSESRKRTCPQVETHEGTTADWSSRCGDYSTEYCRADHPLSCFNEQRSYKSKMFRPSEDSFSRCKLNRSEKYRRRRSSWEQLQRSASRVSRARSAGWIQDLPLEWWEREDGCKDAKAAHMERVDGICHSREDLVLLTTLWDDDIVLEPNMFPYLTPYGVRHFTLWSIKDLSHTEIQLFVDEWITRKYPHVRRWQYDDNSGERSIDLFHVHVFIEMIPYAFTARPDCEYFPPHAEPPARSSRASVSQDSFSATRRSGSMDESSSTHDRLHPSGFDKNLYNGSVSSISQADNNAVHTVSPYPL